MTINTERMMMINSKSVIFSLLLYTKQPQSIAKIAMAQLSVMG
jgi:hypothetical protein